jgi:hypothetical protein
MGQDVPLYSLEHVGSSFAQTWILPVQLQQPRPYTPIGGLQLWLLYGVCALCCGFTTLRLLAVF